MVTYLPRSAWGARAPSSGPGRLLASRVRGAAIHWPGTGSTRPIHSSAAVASALRGWQAFHMDSRGWSDIAYQVAVDQSGRAWTLRGLRQQSGANGNLTLNQQYGAILLVLVTGEQPSSAMKATVRGVVADFRRLFPSGTRIVPHSGIRPGGTDCPGPAARAAIARGEFTPRSSPEDEMTPAQMQELKNFIEARNKAYALWVHRMLSRQLVQVAKAYTTDMKNYERQTDAADAARAAAAVWATQPPPGQGPTDPFDPNEPIDPVEPNEPPLPEIDPLPFPELPPEDQLPGTPEGPVTPEELGIPEDPGTPEGPGTPEQPIDESEPPNPDPGPQR